MDQRRPTLWISVGNCWFFSRFTKINRIPTFIWVMLKNPLKKIVHFSNSCQIAKKCMIFKRLIIFGIFRFMPFWICHGRIQNRRFWTSPKRFSKNCRNFGTYFLQKSFKIAQNRRFWILARQIQIGTNLRIPKMVNFLKMMLFLAIWQPFEKWTIFSKDF